jgi:hypothetical protein
LGDQSIAERIIKMAQEEDIRRRTGFEWFKIWCNGGRCEYDNERTGSLKDERFLSQLSNGCHIALYPTK